MYSEEVNKIARSSNDKITTYPYGTPAIKVCKSEMLLKNKLNRFDDDDDKTILMIEYNDDDKTIPMTEYNGDDNKTIPMNIMMRIKPYL